MLSLKTVMTGLFLICAFAFTCVTASAAPLSVFDGWYEIAAEDTTTYYVDPGYGGQDFDAEYLYYKLEGTSLSIGLQTGFDLSDGILDYNSKTYYAGDLALSFDGKADVYEYAFDFGFLTKDYYGNLVDADDPDLDGIDTAGLYSVTDWNTDNAIYFDQSNPFAMDLGSLIAAVDDNSVFNIYGSGDNEGSLSHYRIATFDLSLFGDDFNFTGLDVHWTMSCGNDAIEGSAPAPVPEPSTLLLLGAGGGLLWLVRRRTARNS